MNKFSEAFDEYIPAIVGAAVVTLMAVQGVVVAWLNRKRQLIEDVRSEAIAAEMQFGRGRGPEKHAAVREKLKGKATEKKLDKIISTEGRAAAHKYRESLVPKGEE
jgi:hypothetical protein